MSRREVGYTVGFSLAVALLTTALLLGAILTQVVPVLARTLMHQPGFGVHLLSHTTTKGEPR